MLKKFFLSLLMIVSMNGYVMAQDEKSVSVSFTQANVEKMMDDIKAYLKQSEDHSPYVTEIVQKHIPLGTPKDDVLDAFKEAGFEMKDFTDSKWNEHKRHNFDQYLYFGTDVWVFPDRFWKQGVAIYIEFKENQVIKRTGRAFYHNPIFKYLP